MNHYLCFEFNRGSILEILSDEIYKSDPYVFIRELLRNAIDAIKLRNARLQLKGVSTISNSVIKINVSHYDNGDFDFCIVDNGIGMDEFLSRIICLWLVKVITRVTSLQTSVWLSIQYPNLGLVY